MINLIMKIKIRDEYRHMLLDEEYYECIKDIINNELVLKMSEFNQHGVTSCLEHSLNVSYNNYKICKNLNLDYSSAARAGLLHDFFLYDWHVKRKNKLFEKHGFTHSKIALSNALTCFTLNNMEKDIILKHMWPLNIALPKYKETYIMIFIDKIISVSEVFQVLNIKRYFLKVKMG